MSMTGDDQFVRYREHIAAIGEIKAKQQELELQTVRLSASLMHLPEKVDNPTNVVQGLAQQIAKQGAVAPEVDHASLALHRALDSIPSRGGGVGGVERVLMLLLTAFASFMAARFFIGGL